MIFSALRFKSPRFWRDLKIGRKFNLVLFLIFLIGVSVCGIQLSNILQASARDTVSVQATILMDFMSSVRHYTTERIVPLIADREPGRNGKMRLTREAIPSYAAAEVIKLLQSKPGYDQFGLKDAMQNPTNPRDKADGFEEGLIEEFKTKQVDRLTGARETSKGTVFYYARPIVLRDTKCLRCHSTADRAPTEQLDMFGREAGFGWRLGEVLGVEVASVPASVVSERVAKAVWASGGISLLFLCFGLLVVKLALNRFIIVPIQKLAKQVDCLNNGQVDMRQGMSGLQVSFSESGDEIGRLAGAFNKIKTTMIRSGRFSDYRR